MMGLIIKFNEKKSYITHPSPFSYKFIDEFYTKALKEGLVVV
jgi:hypothetical protein